MKKPFEFYPLVILLIALSLNGLAGGALLIIQPDGLLLGMQKDWLANTPFSNFLLPGILLFVFNGILPAIALAGLFTKKRCLVIQKFNVYHDKAWGWTFSLYSGITTLVWIIVQQLMTAYFILQPIIASVGILIVIGALMPRVQKLYALSPDREEPVNACN